MPGIPSHILMVEESVSTLSPTTDSDLYAIVNLHPDVVRLGAVGPDLTFFAPDFGDWSVALVRILAEFYDEAVGPIVELYEKWVGPVLDALERVEEGAQVVLDEVTCDLVGTLEDNLNGVQARVHGIVQNMLLNIFNESVNIFDHMTPPIQEGKTEEDWFWFDTLHNRRTDRFIREMWARADTDAKKAYVLGYTSHHAGDLVGHQFVNTVVGSPARGRLQRHHFAENIIDTRLYDDLRSGEITGSRIHLLLPHGTEVENAASLRVLLDNPNEVPDDMRPVFEMIRDAMEATFSGAPHPQRIASEYLTVENLNTAFWFLLVAMKASTSNYIPPPSFPSDEVLGAVSGAMGDFLETATNPPGPSFSPPEVCFALWDDDCDFSLSALQEWAEFLADTITYLGQLLRWLGELIRDLWQVFSCSLTAPAKLALHGAFWLVHETLHALLTYLRECLVQAALIHPEVGWVDTNPVALSFLTVSRRQIAETERERYPHRAGESNAGFHSYPITPTEEPSTRPSAFSIGTRAGQFVDSFNLVPSLMEAFSDALDPAASRDVADANSSVPIGSVTPLTTAIMRSLVNNDTSVLSDWSLDSDRGYGYLNWRIAPGEEESVEWDSSKKVDHDWSR
jgi:hypothetical protein